MEPTEFDLIKNQQDESWKDSNTTKTGKEKRTEVNNQE